MNGVHDMGGMHGLGPIAPELNEPVFHARWEARALALTLALGAWGKWTLDASRHQRELIPPAEYLLMSYYEKWITGLVELALKTNLVTCEEVESGRTQPGAKKATPALAASRVARALSQGSPTERAATGAPLFAPGAKVRARNINPTGHTRLPRYARGHVGLIARFHGSHVFPDANAHGLGEQAQPLYQVRFEARELWGQAFQARGAVYLDLWEDYLEPA
jgi:nitrile hydratase beta subunit